MRRQSSPATARSGRPTCSALRRARTWSSRTPRAPRWAAAQPTGSGSLIIRNVTPGAGYTFRSIDGQKVAATSSFKVLTPSDTPPAVLLLEPAPFRRPQLHHHAGRREARRHRAPAPREDSGRRPVPDGDRGVGLRDRRPAQPHRRRAPPERRDHVGPTGPRHRDRGRLAHRAPARVRDGQPADARDRLLGGCVRPLRSADHLRRLRRGADRRRANRGLPTTRSAWWGSRSRASPRCSSPGPSPPGWPRSRR